MPGNTSGVYRIIYPMMLNNAVVYRVGVSALEKYKEGGVYPRASPFRIMHDIEVGTVEQIADNYREKLKCAAETLLFLDKDYGEQEICRLAWESNAEFQAFVAPMLLPDGSLPAPCVSKLCISYGTPEYEEKFAKPRREMEKDNPCPLSDAKRDLVEGFHLLGLGREGTDGMSVRQIGEMFIQYADWRDSNNKTKTPEVSTNAVP